MQKIQMLLTQKCIKNVTFLSKWIVGHIHIVWKLLKMSHLNIEFWNFPPIFVLLKVTYLATLFDSKIQVFQKLFWHFKWIFGHSKCKRSSLRSQCWMRLFLWFSNTVDFSLHEWIYFRQFSLLKIALFFYESSAKEKNEWIPKIVQ